MFQFQDTNIFVEAKNNYYGFDFCPAFWEWIARENGKGAVFGIEQVQGEILRRADELADWANARGDGFFLSSTPESSAAHAKIIRRVREKGYQPMDIDEFARVADSYLIAHGIANRYKVVTHEISFSLPEKTISERR